VPDFSLGSATTAFLSPWSIFFGGYLAGLHSVGWADFCLEAHLAAVSVAMPDCNRGSVMTGFPVVMVRFLPGGRQRARCSRDAWFLTRG